ncbi:cytochrome c oxidase subunit I [Maritimibacter sp. UBA3975]|uniref:cytochrome c oxidase subunit I n=1 Tax=Maritimibacter sp. UBA3975 TaxID=1946833 RepID=UPI000C091463|nr:cytochrome c oxidase subunit I [Maritimibacter sp. UBA3975]MAM62985.1 cytochrome c oxidase subunit I [Maritimibacter sp.]|tara:strand:+ start:15051 stop:17567 length:2517 start_codon:yes stop_codon:yes gene_type:complete
MSVSETPTTYSGARKGEDKSFEGVWDTPKGIHVLSSVSHRVVGRRFIYTGFVFFLIAGVLALLVRTQLIVPGNTFLDLETYNQVFTMHGTLMMFLFAIPILEGFAVYLIPLMLGARDLIFPRLGQFGYYCYLFGGIIVLSSFVFDAAPDGGWFMYVPLSTKAHTPGLSADFWLIGITFAEIASVTAAVELITAILTARAPGMSLTKMPIFAWYILITAFMIAIGFPPLIIGSILLEAERLLGLPFFDPMLGGDPLLWQHLFWLFGHPEVYIIFLPAAGMVATMLPTFVGKPLFGYGFAVAAVVSMGFISFGLWAHHMFATGLPILSLSLFSAASTMVAVPTAIQVFCFIATLASGRPKLTTPMLFILGFLSIFVLGGLTGVMLASVPFNWQAHDSYFVVAHLHYVLIGGMVFPLIGAFYYWAPHFTGRMMSERLGRWVFGLMFVGFNTTFLLMHITGLRGMPRRVATYAEGLGWDRLNMLSSIGSYILAAGIALFVFDFFRSRRHGPPAPRNPWGAGTLEWLYPPVAPGFNFHAIPPVESREPLWDQPHLLETEAHKVEGVMHGIRDGRRETVGCDPVSGKPLYILRLPHPTWLPMIAAAGLALLFGATLASAYWLCAVGAVIALVAFTLWGWEPSDSGVTRDAGMGHELPVNVVDRRSHMHVALVGTMLVLMALFASLIFGLLYLWNIRPEAAETLTRPALLPAAVAVVLGLAVALFGQLTRRAAVRDRFAGATVLSLLTVLTSLLAVAALGLSLMPIDPWASALGATLWAIGGFVAFNLAVLTYWGLFNAARRLTRRIGPGQSMPDFNLATFAKGCGLMVAVAGAFFIAGAVGGVG